MILPNKPGVELLSIRTLGGLAIWLDDVEVEPPAPGMAVRGAPSHTIALETRTTEALLVYLACTGRQWPATSWLSCCGPSAPRNRRAQT